MIQSAIDEYIMQGVAEHTSVASFNRVSLQLMAFGAPASLLHATMSAAQDEITHAQLMFGFSEKISDLLLIKKKLLQYPKNFPFPNNSVSIGTKADVVRETLVEGVLGETSAAVRLCVRSRTTSNEYLRHLLARVSHDESRHAALAWRTISWAINDEEKETPRQAAEQWLNNMIETRAASFSLMMDGSMKDVDSGIFGLLPTEYVAGLSDVVSNEVVKTVK